MSPQEQVSSAEAAVIDLALFDNNLRTIQALRNSGIVTDDATQADLLVVKRINHAMFGDYAGAHERTEAAMDVLQKDFAQKRKSLAFGQLVENAEFNKLLDGYLAALANDSALKIRHLDNDVLAADEATPARFNELRAKEVARQQKYQMEQKYYRENPDVVKNVARKYQAILETEQFLPTGKIVAKSGVVKGDQNFVDDIVSDVLSVVAARSLKTLGKNFANDEALARYNAEPQANKVRIAALAEKIENSTQPLSSLREIENETPELDRINALKTLLSVQLHYAMSQDRSSEQVAAVEQKARDLVKQATQVSMSLAYDYLGKGPSASDPRTQKIRANLKAEMDKDGVAVLPLEGENGALAQAAKIARASAEDLLQVTGTDSGLSTRIDALAEKAGANTAQTPLEAKSQLIGTDLLKALEPLFNNPNEILTQEAGAFLQREIARRTAAGPVVGVV